MIIKYKPPGPTNRDIAFVLGLATAAIAVAIVLCYFVDKILSTSILMITGM